MLEATLAQIVFVPFLASVVIFAFRKQLGKKAGWVAVLSLMYTTLLLVLETINISGGAVVTESYMVVAPGIKIGFLADGLSIPVALVVNVLCTVLCMYSIHYVDHRIEILYGNESREMQMSYFTRFYYLFLLFPMGFMGVTFATNMVVLYFFMEILSITLFFLMAYFGYRKKMRVAFICLAWGIIGALFFLTAALMTYKSIGTLEISRMSDLSGHPMAVWIIGVALLGLMTKLAIFPFHVWMPWVHAEHPTCIAGLLAVYANLALYIIVRVFVLPLGDDFAVFGTPLMVMALITMIYGSLLTMAQTDIKRLAACSTISQIAYSVLGLGALTIAGIQGGMFFFVSHIMGKTIFFSTAGLVVYATGLRDMNKMGGLARKMPVTTVLFVAGAMMLSGFPPFSSFTAEWIMFTGIFERASMGSSGGIAIAIMGALAIMLTVSYTFAAARKIFFGPISDELNKRDIKDPPLLMIVPLIFVALSSIFLGLYPQAITHFFSMVIN